MRIPGRSVRSGCFHLMPSISMDSCAGVGWILPSRGHRPDEPASFQPFGKHAPAGPAGPQYLYHVAAPPIGR